MPNFMFITAEYSPKNCQNMEFCPQICPSGAALLHSFTQFFHVYRTYVSSLWCEKPISGLLSKRITGMKLTCGQACR